MMELIGVDETQLKLFWWKDRRVAVKNRDWPIASLNQYDRHVVAKIVCTSPFDERRAKQGTHGLLYVHVRPAQRGELQSPVPWTVLPEPFRRMKKAMQAAEDYIKEHSEINWKNDA